MHAETPDRRQRRGVSLVKLLAALAVVGVLVALLLPATRRGTRGAARRSWCGNNLKQIALGIQNYVDLYHALPPAYTVDANGKPLHSWRTLILPFMEVGPISKKIDLNKPWDDPANSEARNTPLPVYRCPSLASDRASETNYLAVVGPKSCFLPSESRKLSEITDGASKTLMVIEIDSDHAVPWMSPIDADEQMVLDIGPKSKLAHPGGVQAAFADGSVHFIEAELPAAVRQALISIAGDDGAAIQFVD
jgi:prepilin-type processing-associated H-X9-DG protein